MAITARRGGCGRKPRTRTVALATSSFSVARSCLLAGVESLQGDHARAVGLLRDVVASTRREGSTLDLALALGNLGVAEDAAGETEQGRRRCEESIALLRQDARKPVLAIGLCNLGYLLRADRPGRGARSLQREPRALARDRGTAHHRLLPRGRCRDLRRAWRRHPRHDPARRRLRHPRARPARFHPHSRRATADTLEAQCREALSAEAFARAWEEGAALDANRCRRLGAPSLRGSGVAAIAGGSRSERPPPRFQIVSITGVSTHRPMTTDPATPATMRDPAEPSDGLEPSTPSLPWRCSTD